jgi:hypothetical protein
VQPLGHLGERDHAPTDPGGYCHPLLQNF